MLKSYNISRPIATVRLQSLANTHLHHFYTTHFLETRYRLLQKLIMLSRRRVGRLHTYKPMATPHNGPIFVSHSADEALFWNWSVLGGQLLLEATLHQTARQGLSARIRFARANSIFIFAVCFGRPRYRVFRKPNCPFTTPNTCSTFALTDDFSCSRRLIWAWERTDSFLICDGRRLVLYLIFFPLVFLVMASSRFSAPRYPLSP